MSWLSKSIKKIIPKKLRPAVFLLAGDPIAATTIGSVLATKGSLESFKQIGKALTEVPKAPKAATAPTAPTIDLAAAAKAAAATEANRIKKKKGYQSTISTGPLGIVSEATTKKNILG